MQYTKHYFTGAKQPSEKYKESYLSIKKYFQSQGFIAFPLRPLMYRENGEVNDNGDLKEHGEIKYYKEPVTSHSFKDVDGHLGFTNEFAEEGLAMGELGLAIYPIESCTNEGVYLSIMDVDSLSGKELEDFKVYLNEIDLPYFNTRKGVHIYGTSMKKITGGNGLDVKIGNFIVNGELRSSGSGYCVTAPTKLVTLDNKLGAYEIGNSTFLDLIMNDSPIPLWSDVMLNALETATHGCENISRNEDLAKVMMGTEKGRGDGVYDINFREIGRLVSWLRVKGLLTNKDAVQMKLEEAINFDKKHIKGYGERVIRQKFMDLLTKELGKKDEPTAEGAKGNSPVDKHLATVKATGTIVVKDQKTSEIYLRVKGQRNMVLGGNESTEWLTRQCHFTNKGQLGNLELRLRANVTKVLDIRTRIALDAKTDEILYSLSGNGAIVRVGKGKWDVVDDDGSEHFKIVSGELKQVVPAKDVDVKEINRIFKYMNVDPHLKPLIVCTLIGYLYPNIAYPILNVFGEKGSGKSTMAYFIKTLLDPNEVPLESADQKKDDNLIISLDNSHVTVYDNLQKINKSFGDVLAQVATGIGFRVRTLHTTKGVSTFTFKKPIIITSVSQEMEREDLLSRSMMIESIPFDGNSISERELKKGFEEDKGIILGAIFEILSRLDLDNVNKKNLIRLSDFHLIARSVEKIMEWKDGTMDKVLAENLSKQEEESLVQNDVAELILRITKEKGELEYSTNDLYEMLCYKDNSLRNQIRNARSFGKELGRIKGTLEKSGLKIEKLSYIDGERKRGYRISVVL